MAVVSRNIRRKSNSFINYDLASLYECQYQGINSHLQRLSFVKWNSWILCIGISIQSFQFVNKVYETTFSGDEYVRRGQHALYITEQCVFQRSAAHDVLKLIEIAPGVDLEKDVLQQMEFILAIFTDLKLMDHQYFQRRKMDVLFFWSLTNRCTYHDDNHVLFIDFFGVCLTNEEEIDGILVSISVMFVAICCGNW